MGDHRGRRPGSATVDTGLGRRHSRRNSAVSSIASTEFDDADVELLALRVVDAVAASRSTWTRWNLTAETMRQLAADNVHFATTADTIAVRDRVVAAAEQLSVQITVPDLATVPDAFRNPDGTSQFARPTVFTSRAVLEAEDRLLRLADDRTGPRVDHDRARDDRGTPAARPDVRVGGGGSGASRDRSRHLRTRRGRAGRTGRHRKNHVTGRGSGDVGGAARPRLRGRVGAVRDRRIRPGHRSAASPPTTPPNGSPNSTSNPAVSNASPRLSRARETAPRCRDATPLDSTPGSPRCARSGTGGGSAKDSC